MFAFDDFCAFNKTIHIIQRGPAVLITPAVSGHRALASTPPPSPTSGYFRLALKRVVVVVMGLFSRDVSILKLEGHLLFFFASENEAGPQGKESARWLSSCPSLHPCPGFIGRAFLRL